MILELAVLNVIPGKQQAFERDFRKASQYIASAPGYIRHSLKKCVEIEGQYLLMVEWQSLEAHEVGFRRSPPYQQWKALLHHYYNPFPEVLHYSDPMNG